MSIQSGRKFTVTLDDEGSVWWFGDIFTNGGYIEKSSIPKRIEDISNVIEISCGIEFILFVDVEGFAYYKGKLFGKVDPLTKFETLKDIMHVSSGRHHGVFLDTFGNCFGVGKSIYDSLGMPEEMSNASPLPKKIIHNAGVIKQIACGDYYTCLLNEDGKVFGCGSNSFKQLSTKYEIGKGVQEIYYPETIELMSAGSYHLLALSEHGNVWAVGSCSDGKSGIKDQNISSNGSTTKVNFPEDVIIKALATAVNHSLAIDSEGNLWTFGKSYVTDKSYRIPTINPSIQNVLTLCQGGLGGYLLKTQENICVFSNLVDSSRFGVYNIDNEENIGIWPYENYHIIGSNPYWLKYNTIKSARK